MLIDFDLIEETVIPHFRGGEKELAAAMHVDPANKIMRGRLVPGASIGLHAHETSSEIIYILSGRGRAVCDGADEVLTTGSCHYCPKGQTHTLINDGDADLCFFAVVPEQ